MASQVPEEEDPKKLDRVEQNLRGHYDDLKEVVKTSEEGIASLKKKFDEEISEYYVFDKRDGPHRFASMLLDLFKLVNDSLDK